jgi:Protein of unknown function (DUF3048) C-terminal domain
MTASWRRIAAGLAAAGGLVVAGCAQDPLTSGSSPSATSSPSASASASTSSHATAPLTGLWAASASAAAKPAVALALAGPDPQGLTSADVVFEAATSPVHYIAVYQSKLNATAGPVTTTQPADRQILAVLHPLIGYDGAALPYFLKLLDNGNSKITDAGYSRYPSAYTATSTGVSTSPQALVNAVSGSTAPPPLFPYRSAASGVRTLASTGVFRPTSVGVSMPGQTTQSWTFSTHTDRWTLTSGGPQVTVANLVVQRVPYKDIGVNRKHGIVLPNAEVTGSGGVEVFSGSSSGDSGGTAASGTWSKPHTSSLTNYFDSSGHQMAFQTGPTWVIFAPPGTQISTSK